MNLNQRKEILLEYYPKLFVVKDNKICFHQDMYMSNNLYGYQIEELFAFDLTGIPNQDNIYVNDSRDSVLFTLYAGQDVSLKRGLFTLYTGGMVMEDHFCAQLYEYNIELYDTMGYIPPEINLKDIYTRYHRKITIDNIIKNE